MTKKAYVQPIRANLTKRGKKMKYTKAKAKETVSAYKDMTCYFDGSLKQSEMYDMLRNRLYFGEAETRCIIASLVIAGAKFTE